MKYLRSFARSQWRKSIGTFRKRGETTWARNAPRPDSPFNRWRDMMAPEPVQK